MAKLTAEFEWDGTKAGLGPHWFNIDNLEACLFSDAHTLRKLLTVTKAVGVDGEQRSAQRQEAKRDNLDTVVMALYANEINCSISSFWDGGFMLKVQIGDELNGYKAQNECMIYSAGEMCEWLIDAASRLYPDSEFATHKGDLSGWLESIKGTAIDPTIE